MKKLPLVLAMAIMIGVLFSSTEAVAGSPHEVKILQDGKEYVNLILENKLIEENGRNYFMDCRLFTCQGVFAVTTNKDTYINPGTFYAIAEPAYEEVDYNGAFVYEEYNITITENVYVTVLTNTTVEVCNNQTGKCKYEKRTVEKQVQNGTNSSNITLGKWISTQNGYLLKQGMQYRIMLNFSRTELLETDLVIYAFGEELAQLAWWGTSLYKRQLNITSGVNSTNLDFPAFAIVDTATLISAGKMRPHCEDLQMANGSDEADISEEVVHCNSATTEVYMRIPGMYNSSIVNSVYMHYGDSTSTNDTDDMDVWRPAGYKSVFHIEDNGTVLFDSSGHMNLTRMAAASNCALVSTAYGYGINFTNDCVYNNTVVSFTHLPQGNNQTTVTIFSITGTSYVNEYESLMAYGTAGQHKMFIPNIRYSWPAWTNTYVLSTYQADWNTAVARTEGSLVKTFWMLNTTHKLFKRGTDTTLTLAYTTANVGNTLFSVGANYGAEIEKAQNSTITEIRIRNVTSTNDWILAEQLQGYVVGAEETNAPIVQFVSPTPVNGTNNFTYGMVFNFTSSTNMSNCSIEIDGTNKTGTRSSDNLSCSYAPSYAEHIFNNSYDVIGWANVSGTYYATNETRVIPYYGCGYVVKNGNLIGNLSIGGTGVACFTMNTSNILFDGNNNKITKTSGTSTKGMVISASNITIENVTVISFNQGVRTTSVSNLTLINNTITGFNNYGIFMDAVTASNIINNTLITANGDVVYITGSSGASKNNIISGNKISGVSANKGIDLLSGGVTYNLFKDNMITNISTGIYLYASSHNNFTNNSVSLSSSKAVFLDNGAYGNTFVNNSFYSSGKGIYSEDSSNNNLYENTHVYNNTIDLYISSTKTIILNNITFDNPIGNFTNYTSLSIYDVSIADTYQISWSLNSSTPPYKSFANKYINITNLSSGVSIDNINWTWTESEVTGYEFEFELWELNSTSEWTLINSTPDISNNVLSAYALTPHSVYGILEKNVVSTQLDIWNGTEWITYNSANRMTFRCSGNLPTYCTPANQNNNTAQPILKNTNIGSVTSTYQEIKVNVSWAAEGTLKCGMEAGYQTAINLTTSYQNYSTSDLPYLSSNYLYCWLYVSAISAEFPRTFTLDVEDG